ncbi:MAG: heme-binding protein [Ruminococcaceae bacterium]|nr:heme-binding protein [Oscillospiraceae bacterium]
MNQLDLEKIVQSVVSDMKSERKQKCVVDTSKMNLALARRIVRAVEKRAAEIGVNAVVAVADAGGNPVAIECMDDSYLASYDVALQKSYTVVALKMSTIELKKLSQPGGSLYGIQFTNNGRIVIFGGGEPLKVGDKVIGGLGVSGGSEEQDTALAEYGREFFRELTLKEAN